MKKLAVIVSLLLIATAIINAQQIDFPELSGKYLGQKLPGIIPEIFAPDIVSLPETLEWSSSLSPDSNDF